MLTGVKILDLTRLLPGPMATKSLAELGAEVIKIDSPGGGDYMRHFGPQVNGEGVYFNQLNQGKRIIELDLKNPEHRGELLKLVKDTHVLVESFRPGVMERLGLGFDTLKETNPHLIYCAITGYGQTGPLSQLAGHDLNFQALSGVLAQSLPEAAPSPVMDLSTRMPGLHAGDVAGAQTAVVQIMAALHEKNRQPDFSGRFLDISMLDSLRSWNRIYEAHRRATGELAGTGRSILMGSVVCYNLYRTAEGRYLAVGALEKKFWAAFCRLVNRPDWIEQGMASARPGEAAYDQVAALVASKNLAQWKELLRGQDVCVTPVLTVGETL